MAYENILKTGDFVECINMINGKPGRGAGWELGKIFQVLSIDNSGVVWPSNGTSGVYLDSVRILTGKIPLKIPLICKHVVIQDTCQNFVSINNSYKEAEESAKKSSNNVTIYKLIEVAHVTSERIVKKKK